MTEAAPLELRVLAGRVRGASAPMDMGRSVTVGHDFENDIVLRDATAKGVRFRIRAKADTAELQVLEGQVELLGHALEAPASAVLPPYMPLIVGDSAVALGAEGSSRWSEAERLVAVAMRKGVDEDDEDEDTERSAPWLLTRWHGLAARMPTALPAVAVIAVGASLFLAAGAAPDWVTPPTKAETVQTALSESGYRTLKVARSEDGRLTVTGLVATEKDRARLQRLLQARKFEVAVQVQTGERLALTVEDVFRANGLEAKARSTAPGVVRVEVRDAAEGEIASVQKLAVQEVPGLKHLGVDRIGGPPPEAAPEPKPLVISADPGKRVTSVVDGDLDYIATEDGSRYFAGAILPTGHRLLDVQDQIVSVEKDGAVSQLVF